jgi:hypothetical protein
LSRRGHFDQNPVLKPDNLACDFLAVGLSEGGTAGAVDFALVTGGFGTPSVGTI